VHIIVRGINYKIAMITSYTFVDEKSS